MRKFFAVLTTRNKEFIRDHSALSWNFIFPFLVIFGFAFAFSSSSQDIFKVATFLPPQVTEEFTQTQYIHFIPITDLDEALSKLQRHQLDLVLYQGPDQVRKYWINSTSPKGYLVERILWGSSSKDRPFLKQSVQGHEIRYVDWLIAGLLAMNMMFSSLFGVGYNIVRYRKNGVLKRLKATPLKSFEFLLAQVISRLFLIVGVTFIVYFGCNFFIHFQMLGSYLNLFLVLLLGSMSLISLSLLLASRTSSEEFAGGILNLISWPMIFLSGVWFSLEGAHPWIKKLAQIFPLTHTIDAARAIMTEGAAFSQIADHLIVLALMTLVFLTVGALAFKWK